MSRVVVRPYIPNSLNSILKGQDEGLGQEGRGLALTEWKTPTFMVGWGDYTKMIGGGFPELQYTLDRFGHVWWRGLLYRTLSGSVSAGTVMMQFPIEYAPTWHHAFLCGSGYGSQRVDVHNDGTIIIQGTAEINTSGVFGATFQGANTSSSFINFFQVHWFTDPS